MPFIGFFQSDDPEFEPADDIAERLVQAATVHASLGFWDVGAPQLVVEWGATVENGMTGPTSLGAEVDFDTITGAGSIAGVAFASLLELPEWLRVGY